MHTQSQLLVILHLLAWKSQGDQSQPALLLFPNHEFAQLLIGSNEPSDQLDNGGKLWTVQNSLDNFRSCKRRYSTQSYRTEYTLRSGLPQRSLTSSTAMEISLSASEIQDMNDNLSLQKTVLEKIKRIRDESLAHLDAKFEPSSPPTVGEMNSLISTIEKIFNRLSSGHNRNVYSWSFQANRSATQTANILDILQEEMRKRTAEAEEAIQDSRNA